MLLSYNPTALSPFLAYNNAATEPDAPSLNPMESKKANKLPVNPNDSSDQSEWEVSYAGVVRSVLSSIVRRSTRFLRTGLKVRPRTLAHSTDRLKELVEFREHYSEGHEGTQETSQKQGKLQKFKHIAKEIMPGFLKHVGFATIVFSTYENIYDDYYREFQTSYTLSPQNSDFSKKILNLSGPLLCGGLSGTFGGIFISLWDRISDRMDNIRHNAHNAVPSSSSSSSHGHGGGHHGSPVKPTVLSFTFSQSILFSSYECMKWVFLYFPIHETIAEGFDELPSFVLLEHGDSPSHQHHSTKQSKFSTFYRRGSTISFGADVVCISACGGLAGMISEVFQQWYRYGQLRRIPEQRKILAEVYDHLLQEDPNKSRWLISMRYWRHVLIPSSHAMINAALPMSLAFLAYEYGKETMHEHHEQHHHQH